MTATAAHKKTLRAAAMARRHVAARQAPAGAALLAAEQFLGHIPQAATLAEGSVVAGYWPVGDELDPRPLMERLVARGCAVALPVVERAKAPLIFRRWRPGEALVAGALKIPVPPESAPRLVPEILLVPLLAFDRAGHRLGYGGGFYDRTLAALRAGGRQVLAVGLAYAGQEVPALPREEWDQPVDWLVSEKAAHRIGPTGKAEYGKG